MTTETLRSAAALMRERAESTPSDSTLDRYDHGGGRLAVFGEARGPGSRRELVADFYGGGGPREHYTSWHPAVALAVADWLEKIADEGHDGDGPEGCADCDPAIDVADAYLRQSPMQEG